MKITPSLLGRLAGLCALCALTIAGYHLKLAWWFSNLPAEQRPSTPIVGDVLIGAIAVVATVGCWREKYGGYVLVLVLAAIENISAMTTHYSIRADQRIEDLLGLALSGAPLIASMVAATVLLFTPRRAGPPVI